MTMTVSQDLHASNVTATANGVGEWIDMRSFVPQGLQAVRLDFFLKHQKDDAAGGTYVLYWRPLDSEGGDGVYGMPIAVYSTYDENATELEFATVQMGYIRSIVTGTGLNVMPQAVVRAG